MEVRHEHILIQMLSEARTARIPRIRRAQHSDEQETLRRAMHRRPSVHALRPNQLQSLDLNLLRCPVEVLGDHDVGDRAAIGPADTVDEAR